MKGIDVSVKFVMQLVKMFANFNPIWTKRFIKACSC